MYTRTSHYAFSCNSRVESDVCVHTVQVLRTRKSISAVDGAINYREINVEMKKRKKATVTTPSCNNNIIISNAQRTDKRWRFTISVQLACSSRENINHKFFFRPRNHDGAACYISYTKRDSVQGLCRVDLNDTEFKIMTSTESKPTFKINEHF